ncbi:hypothetical protein J1N35_041248 [Gossypium stocksii]|uniref:Uncharacterized protein n=1 Tax=Gossypium stocksii TaxID=47602 RepID=A0A9D3ZIH7_9ROSI|nr:hypothetical protein J1N35_041248 [Gossypium stocksii]
MLETLIRGVPSSYIGKHSVSNIGFNVGLMRMNDVLPTAFTGERTFNPIHETAIEVDNKEEVETNDDQMQESGLDGSEIVLFFEPEVVPTKLEESDSDNEGLDYARETKPDFTVYEPLLNMLNIDIDAQDEFEFSELLHRKPGHASFSTNFNDLQVRMDFSSKDIAAVK